MQIQKFQNKQQDTKKQTPHHDTQLKVISAEDLIVRWYSFVTLGKSQIKSQFPSHVAKKCSIWNSKQFEIQ